jgi:amidase
VIGLKVNKQLIEPFTAGLSKQFKKNVLKLPQSLRILRKSGAVAEALLNDYDLIMTPVLSHKVPRIGYFSVALPYDEITRRAVDFSSFTAGQNITGSPSISIPSATSSDGLPMGMNFIAPYGNERRLLELAYELELARPWKFVYNS